MPLSPVELPATRVASIRRVGPYREVGPTFHAIVDFGASWDDPSTAPPEELRTEIWMPVA